MSVAELPVSIDREKIAGFCRARGIRKLSLFGSVLRNDFQPGRSDVDVVVEFLPGVHPGLKFFGYGDELAELIGQKVTVVISGTAATFVMRGFDPTAPLVTN